MEIITKAWCPECKKPSFVNHGNMRDLTRPDIEGQQCPHCSHVWTYEGIDLEPGEEPNIELGVIQLN